MSDYAEMRRNYDERLGAWHPDMDSIKSYHTEERKMHRFFKRCDSATFCLAVIGAVMALILFGPAIMRTAQAIWRGM